MAKAALNSALISVRGTIDNWVYRKTTDGLVIARRPEGSQLPRPGQIEAREQFRAAVAYAKAVQVDPVLGPRYAAAAAASGLRSLPFAVRDFLTPPHVDAIDATAYHGAIGDVIKVRARDHFEVAGVTLIIRGANNAVREQGAALLGADGLWHYTATTATPVGTAVKLEAVAMDRPGHTGSRQEPVVVA